MHTELIEIITKDKVRLGALWFTPTKRRPIATIVWVSGLMSATLARASRTLNMAKLITRHGFGFVALDHRGAGVITGLKRGIINNQSQMFGTVYENFADSIFDIQATINFLKQRGEKNIFLLGHSTGANKLAYFIKTASGRNIRGVGLLGPVSDVPGWQSRLGKKYKSVLNYAKRLIKTGHGLDLMPAKLVNGEWWSASRFVSIAEVGGKEDTFPYYRKVVKFSWVKKVSVPVCVIIGENDQHLDRSAKQVLDSFEAQVPGKYFTGFIIPRTDHGFYGEEPMLVNKLSGWIKRVLKNPKS